MKHQCEHCATRYQIPDERVRGRILQVRCKQCRGVMVVVGPTERFDEATMQRPPTLTGLQPPVSSIPIAHEEEEPAWWCAIGGRPHGPYTKAEIRALVERGDVHARSRMWCHGMGGWERVAESPSLSWVYGKLLEEGAADEPFGEPSRVLDRAALVSDGSGYFPDPTLHSGFIILDEATQAHLTTLARKNGIGRPPRGAPVYGPALAAGLGFVCAVTGVFWLLASPLSG